MSNLADDVIEGVNSELSNLGGSPPPGAVEEIVVRHAKMGAGDDPVLQQEAADLARTQLENGMAPDAAAVSAATQAHQKSVSQRPSLDDQVQELLGHRPSGSNGRPGRSEVDQYLQDHNVDMTSRQREVLSDATSAFNDVGMSPELAAQAQLAIANAAQGGGLLPAGIEITGNLRAVVHDNVDLHFKSSEIKTTVGRVEQTHSGDFHLEAKDVKLTAFTVGINASKTETNIVKTSKRSIRREYTGSLGSHSITTMPLWDMGLTGVGVDINALNASFSPIRVGTAYCMNTRGLKRNGMKGATYETVKDKFTEKMNSNILKFVIIAIIL